MTVAYCGTPPSPGELLARFNLDPVLIGVLALLAGAHLWRTTPDRRPLAAAGWGVAAVALVSPLCALSVSLFSARVAQHMVLVLVAAPLVAAALPVAKATRGRFVASGIAFFVALWLWHMPALYDATFVSTPLYWAMHATLFASAVALWRLLIDTRGQTELPALVAGGVAAVHMGLLGAILTFAARPLYTAHILTTEVWGFSRLGDQQLGGLLMWVPGGFLFVALALRSVAMLLREPQGTMTAGNA